MLENTTEELTLVIPSSVQKIDEDITENHILTIVSDIKTEAEAFARIKDIKFLITDWFELDYGNMGDNQ